MNYSQLLSDCWAYGTSYLPPMLCGLPTWATAFLPQLGVSETIPLGTRRFQALQKLGEGGYAVVYLVSEMQTPEHPHPDPELRALKKVLVQSSEHLDAVQQEMLVHSAVHHHPNILPLLDYCCSEAGGAGSTSSRPSAATAAAPPMTPPLPLGPPCGAAGAAAARPPLPDVNAAGSVSSDHGYGVVVHVPSASGGGGGGGRLPAARSAGEGPAGPGCQSLNRVACFLFPVFRDGTLASELDRLAAAGQMLPTREVLSLFSQLCKAAAHIHAHGYAHRDIKPLNVLIAVNPDHPSLRGGQQAGRGGAQAGPGRPGGRRIGLDDAADVEAAEALNAGPAGAGGADGSPRYRCVLMDFGSARPRTVQVESRSQALQLQEDAEAHCSAPYRAAELFDVPSPAPLDFAASDVWALGATLFHVMYGEPPFQRAMNASGGSLALAVLNCAIGWPRPPARTYPPQCHQLVLAAMAAEPSARPSAAQLAEMAADLAHQGLPDPGPPTVADRGPGKR